jgi:membrane protease YdiL (CAAX protease family)
MSKIDAEPESVRYLILVAIGWWLLSEIPAVIFGIALAANLVPGSTESQRLVSDLSDLMANGIVVLSAIVRGRIIGRGDVKAGIGYEPIARRPIVALMAILISAQAAYGNILLYQLNRDSLLEEIAIAAASPWLGLYGALRLVVIEPVCEEVFFRGWLWTGLRNHWGPLPTAALTGTTWLVLHLFASTATPVWLLPVAVILSIARHFGGSVRASIALHILYNSIFAISPWALRLAGLL